MQEVCFVAIPNDEQHQIYDSEDFVMKKKWLAVVCCFKKGTLSSVNNLKISRDKGIGT
jgi:hypothetical protein